MGHLATQLNSQCKLSACYLYFAGFFGNNFKFCSTLSLSSMGLASDIDKASNLGQDNTLLMNFIQLVKCVLSVQAWNKISKVGLGQCKFEVKFIMSLKWNCAQCPLLKVMKLVCAFFKIKLSLFFHALHYRRFC